MIFKCRECGNTFNNEIPNQDDVVSCPICEAQYKAILKCGKIHLEDFVFEEKDLGEL
jgi:DNA-directed RNA polymerase subunit RPC12/RpoP